MVSPTRPTRTPPYLGPAVFLSLLSSGPKEVTETPTLWFCCFTILLHGVLRELRRRERGKMAPDGRREATARRRPRACEGAGRWPPAPQRRACSARPAGEPREHARALLRVRSRGSYRPVGLPTLAVCSALWRRDGEALGGG